MEDLLALPLGAPVPIEALERQKRWELEGVNRAIRRFREIEADQTLDQRSAGRSALKDVVPRLTILLKDAQASALEGIANAGRGRPASWWWYIGLVPADQLAVLTVVNVLSRTSARRPIATNSNRVTGIKGSDQPVAALSRAISRSIKIQAEFGQFVVDQRAAAKAAKATGDAYANLYEALRRSARKIDTRAVKTWFRRIKKLREPNWPEPDEIQLGAALLSFLVAAGGGWFETVLVPLRGGKTQKVLRMTTLAMRAMEDITERAESGQAYLMPMLCPPLPWRYECPPSN